MRQDWNLLLLCDRFFVAYVRDGVISRIYEYFDTGQIGKFLGPTRRSG